MADKSTTTTSVRPFEDQVRKALRAVLGGTARQRHVAEATGIPVGTIKDWYMGKTIPPTDRFIEVAKALDLDPGALLKGAAVDNPAATSAPGATIGETVRISVLDVQAAAGGGSFNDRALEVEAIDWPRAFLRKVRANPRTTDSLRAAGDSMAPTIETGAFLLVDRSQNDLPAPRNGRPRMPDIFVFVQGKTLRVKRIERIDDNWLALISDNYAMHPPEIVRLGAITIIGKVVWWDNRL